MTKKLEPLPKSDDEYFEGAETYLSTPVKIFVCKTHGKRNWKKHMGYEDNGDGTASCTKCGWGFVMPGYLRILDGKVFDLREG
jgi:hypothetical protein